LDTVYNNIYFLIIGKYFSSVELGYYTRADQFSKLPSQNITGIVQRVSYPVLASIQHDDEQLKRAYRKLIRSIMYITFIAMLGMAAIAQPMILILVGEKWMPSVPYLQLLCMVGMLYPLHAINLNMLNVKGRSDLFLRLEIIKKVLAVPIIIIAIMVGIKAMIIGMIILSFSAYFLNAYFSGKLIGYSVKDQIWDVFPSFCVAFVMALSIWMISFLITSPFLLISIQVLTGAAIVTLLSNLFQLNEFFEIKQFISGKFLLIKHKIVNNAK
jgi:O-antigen/teichoic acid export membrane protein